MQYWCNTCNGYHAKRDNEEDCDMDETDFIDEDDEDDEEFEEDE